MKVAFLGLGRMGRGMAGCLLSAGHGVTLWNRSPGKADGLVAAGGRLAATPRDAAENADAVFAMVADDAASRAVWQGPDGALASIRRNAFAIECSTLSAAHVQQLASAARETGARYIDCPVTGLPDAAAAGTLTLLVGACIDDIEAARPLLEPISSRIFRFGEVGAGTAYKLLINLMGAVQIAGLAEGMALAQRLGLDGETVAEAIVAGTAASPQVVRHAARMARRSFDEPTFTAALRRKDAAYGVELAHAAGLAVPLGEAALSWFDTASRTDPDGCEGKVVDAVLARG